MPVTPNHHITKLPVIALVVPCYNEELALPQTVPVLLEILDSLALRGEISEDSYILCVNDGSEDGTWDIVRRLNSENNRVKGISLSHNRGHQKALFAGLMAVRSKCDAAISLDSDLQDDPAVIADMVSLFKQGNDIVYGVRASRSTESWFKRTSAHAFYRLQKKLGLEAIYDHADYRLMSRRSLDILSQYREQNLYLRGIVPQIGLQSAVVRYDRSGRVAGETKYSLKKMMLLSVDGITSFTSRPIRYVLYFGLILLLVDIVVAVYVLLSYFGGDTVSGWTSIMLSIWFLGSLILIGMGIVGEYVGKIYMEVKNRPLYDISDSTD